MFSVDPEAVFMGGVSGSHAGITAKRALRGPTSLDCLFRVNYREHVQEVLPTLEGTIETLRVKWEV